MTEKKITNKEETKNLVRTLPTRGRTFQGKVIKKFQKRAVIEIERTLYIQKFERYSKKKTKLHARIPEALEVEVGDLVKVRETRPQSKIIHFLVVEIVRKAETGVQQ